MAVAELQTKPHSPNWQILDDGTVWKENKSGIYGFFKCSQPKETRGMDVLTFAYLTEQGNPYSARPLAQLITHINGDQEFSVRTLDYVKDNVVVTTYVIYDSEGVARRGVQEGLVLSDQTSALHFANELMAQPPASILMKETVEYFDAQAENSLFTTPQLFIV